VVGMRRVGQVVLMLLVLLTLGVCDGTPSVDQPPAGLAGDAQGDFGAPDRSDAVEGSRGSDAEVPHERPPLAGYWAQRRFYSSLSDLPVLGMKETSTTSISLVKIEEHENGQLTLVTTLCGIDIDNGAEGMVDVLVPDAFVRSIPQATLSATLTREERGWRFFQPRHFDVRGAVLESKADESLPVDVDDPRVFDQDEDGEPGVTMIVTGLTQGRLFIVQRTSYELDGFVVSDLLIEGRADWTDEQVLLASDNPNLTGSPPKTPKLEASTFTMLRLTGEPDCNTAREALRAKTP